MCLPAAYLKVLASGAGSISSRGLFAASAEDFLVDVSQGPLVWQIGLGRLAWRVFLRVSGRNYELTIRMITIHGLIYI